MRNAYLSALYKLAEQDKNVLSLISDNGMIVYDDFRAAFPNQYFNFGISECHMIAAAAGMATCGKIPFAYTISSFLAYRAYEFLRLDVCLEKLNVKIVGIGTGVSYGYLGPTHHTTEDLALLRSLPNLTVFSPASPMEARGAVEAAYQIDGPVYIRLGSNGETEVHQEDFSFETGKGAVIFDGTDLAIVSTGAIVGEVKKAAERLREEGRSVRLISMHTIKPFDETLIAKTAQKVALMVVVEEHNMIGGLGSAVAEVLAQRQIPIPFYQVGLYDEFAKGYGNCQQVREQNGLDAAGIYNKIRKIWNERITESDGNGKADIGRQ